MMQQRPPQRQWQSVSRAEIVFIPPRKSYRTTAEQPRRVRRALRHEIDRSAASRQILLEAMAVSALADAAKVAADRFWRAGSPL